MVRYLYGFNYADYLERHLLVGEVDPWRRTDEGNPLRVLLVTVDVALEECKEWSKQDIGRQELVDYLKLNDILCLRNVEEFSSIKEKLKKGIPIDEPKKKKKKFTEEQLLKLKERMRKLNEEKHK